MYVEYIVEQQTHTRCMLLKTPLKPLICNGPTSDIFHCPPGMNVQVSPWIPFCVSGPTETTPEACIGG